MKNSIHTIARSISITAASLMFITQAHALINFSDNFNSGASPSWGNEVGGWSATGGVYKPASPNNFPAAYSSLPFNLANFTVDFDVNGPLDGGIFLRSAPEPGTAVGIEGVIFGLKTTAGPARVYWNIVTNGTSYSSPINVVNLTYGTTPHIHLEVSGNTYNAFVNGAPTPTTSLTIGFFTSGEVALYDNSSQSFDNFVLQEVPEPSAGILLVLGACGAAYVRNGKRNRSLSPRGYQKGHPQAKVAE